MFQGEVARDHDVTNEDDDLVRELVSRQIWENETRHKYDLKQTFPRQI